MPGPTTVQTRRRVPSPAVVRSTASAGSPGLWWRRASPSDAPVPLRRSECRRSRRWSSPSRSALGCGPGRVAAGLAPTCSWRLA